MDYLRTLVIAGLFAAGTANAGYAELAPPERFSGGPGSWKFAPSANDARYGKIAFQPNGLRVPVPGVTATMPAAYRFSANAPKIAAAVIFANPYLRAGVGIATWLGVAGIVWDAVNQKWTIPNTEGSTQSTGFQYRTNEWPSNGPWYDSYSQACSAGRAYVSSASPSVPWTTISCTETMFVLGRSDSPESRTDMGITKRPSSCPSGWYKTPAGCVQTPPPANVNKEKFEDDLALKPMPETVPWELPFPTPLPVDDPFINPNPSPNPQHKPKFVPTGEPVKNPNYDPNASPGPANEPWLQPGIRVTPKPTSSEPWRVQIDPVNVPQSGPEPLPDTPNEPGPNDQAKPEEQQSLCEKHPDIVACQKLGTLEPVDLQKKSVSLTIDKEDGFGPSNGACPAPKSFVIMGKPMAFRWDLLCDFATQIRPLLVGFAYLSAALAFMGLSRRD